MNTPRLHYRPIDMYRYIEKADVGPNQIDCLINQCRLVADKQKVMQLKSGDRLDSETIFHSFMMAVYKRLEVTLCDRQISVKAFELVRKLMNAAHRFRPISREQKDASTMLLSQFKLESKGVSSDELSEDELSLATEMLFFHKIGRKAYDALVIHYLKLFKSEDLGSFEVSELRSALILREKNLDKMISKKLRTALVTADRAHARRNWPRFLKCFK